MVADKDIIRNTTTDKTDLRQVNGEDVFRERGIRGEVHIVNYAADLKLQKKSHYFDVDLHQTAKTQLSPIEMGLIHGEIRCYISKTAPKISAERYGKWFPR